MIDGAILTKHIQVIETWQGKNHKMFKSHCWRTGQTKDKKRFSNRNSISRRIMLLRDKLENFYLSPRFGNRTQKKKRNSV